MKRLKIIKLVLITIFLFAGCNNNPLTPTVSLDSDFNIKFGSSVYIPEENLSITFEDVIQDSRCPRGAMCYAVGTAKIKLMVKQGKYVLLDTVQTELQQSIISIGEVNNSYLFWVKALEPYPEINTKISKNDYVLALNVSHFTYGFSDSEIENKTGIFGQTFIGPTAPVERLGFIDYKPYRTTLKFVDSKNDSTIVPTDSTGRFIVYLTPGEYRLVSNYGLPRLITAQSYTVAEGKMNYITVNFDSGIR